MSAPTRPKRYVKRATFTCEPATRGDNPCTHCGGAGAFTKPWLVIKTCFHCAGSGFLDTEVDAVLDQAVAQAIGLLRTSSSKAFGLAHNRLLQAQMKAAQLLGQTAEAGELADLRYIQVGDEPDTSGAPFVLAEVGAA